MWTLDSSRVSTHGFVFLAVFVDDGRHVRALVLAKPRKESDKSLYHRFCTRLPGQGERGWQTR